MLRPSVPIVDFGCGTGDRAVELLMNGLGPVAGLDISLAAVASARAKTLKAAPGLSQRSSFHVANGLRTAFRDGVFGFGIVQAVLTNLTTPAARLALLREARRIIYRPEGGLYVADFLQTWEAEQMRTRYETGERETGEVGSFLVRNVSTGNIEFQAHHFTEEELVGLLGEAGFTVREFRHEAFVTRTGKPVRGAAIWAT